MCRPLEIFWGPEGYGINFKGDSPVLVDMVLSHSTAEQGGLLYGDILVELNGREILGSSRDEVVDVIKVCGRQVLQIKVGRVAPIPTTLDNRKELTKILRNMVSCVGDSY